MGLVAFRSSLYLFMSLDNPQPATPEFQRLLAFWECEICSLLMIQLHWHGLIILQIIKHLCHAVRAITLGLANQVVQRLAGFTADIS